MAYEPENYDIPYHTRISGGLRLGEKVTLEGLIPEQSKWFYIQLANGQHDRAKTLRLEVHFADYPYAAIVLRNCFQENRPRVKESPWKPGGRFTIEIRATRNSYEIFADNRFLDEFPLCLPPKDTIFLEMDGNVILEDLHLPKRR